MTPDPDPPTDPKAWLLELRERFTHRNWDAPVRIVALGNINTAPAFVNCTVGQLLSLVSSALEAENQVAIAGPVFDHDAQDAIRRSDHWRADR
jgi:hypothetical protein